MTTRVAILAQDLIWRERLDRAVRAAAAEPVLVRRPDDLEGVLADAPFLVVDLTALAYDGESMVARAAAAGARVLAVGQHDDVAARKRALAAGAERVLAYRKLAEDGGPTLQRWLAS